MDSAISVEAQSADGDMLFADTVLTTNLIQSGHGIDDVFEST